VTFGGAATWPKVLSFELALEQGLITNADGSFGWAVDPFTLASQAEIRVRSTLLADIAFKYPLAFCASSDSDA
jgi:hypothetical protein